MYVYKIKNKRYQMSNTPNTRLYSEVINCKNIFISEIF